jgi:hypothetical protein
MDLPGEGRQDLWLIFNPHHHWVGSFVFGHHHSSYAFPTHSEPSSRYGGDVCQRRTTDGRDALCAQVQGKGAASLTLIERPPDGDRYAAGWWTYMQRGTGGQWPCVLRMVGLLVL